MRDAFRLSGPYGGRHLYLDADRGAAIRPKLESGAFGARNDEGSEMTEFAENAGIAEDPDAPEIDEMLQQVLIAALNEAKRVFLGNGGMLVPFTALAKEGKMELAPHAVGEVDDCFDDAQRCVAASEGMEAYAFCYDGYVDTDEGQCDILIAEGGLPGDEEGCAIGYIYHLPENEGDPIEVEEEPVYVGPAPNFFNEG